MSFFNLSLSIKEFALATIIFAIIFFIGMMIGCMIQKFKNRLAIKKEREDAIKKSRAVLAGQFTEQFAPYLPNFPCNPGDAKFIGKPIDFIAFPGIAEGNDVEEVLLIEIKTGSSKLSEREKQIKNAVARGKVRYVELNY